VLFFIVPSLRNFDGLKPLNGFNAMSHYASPILRGASRSGFLVSGAAT
jgi:hypothetical protein